MTTTLTRIQTATTPLSVNEIQQYRNLLKNAIVLIVLGRLGRASGASELAEILDIDRGTAAKYLNQLCLVGLVTRLDHKDGYMLTDDGKQLMLQVPAGFVLDEAHIQSFAQQQPHALTLHFEESVPATSTALHGQIIDGAMSKFSPYEQIENVQNGEKVEAMGKISPFNVENFPIAKLLKKKEEDLNYLKTKDSTSSSFKSFNSSNGEIFPIDPIEWPSVQLILENSDMLLTNQETGEKEVVFTAGLDLANIPPRLALAWVAQMYCEPGNMKSPASNAHVRLQKHGNPKRKFLENPTEYLPLDYLQVLGLAAYYVPRCTQCDSREGSAHEHWCPRAYSKDELERVIAETKGVIADDEAAQQAIEERFASVDPQIIKAWQMVIKTLQVDMPRAQFETWVRDTRPFDWNTTSKTITVAAHNQYNCDWLKSNIAETMTGLLAEILGGPASIKFEVVN